MEISPKITGPEWWKKQRQKYNIGLLVSGICAFTLYAIVVFTHEDVIPNAEITAFYFGLYFSVALPFCIPAYILFLSYHHPAWWILTT